MTSKKPLIDIMTERIREEMNDKAFPEVKVMDIMKAAAMMFNKKSEIMGTNTLGGVRGLEFCNILAEWMDSEKPAIAVAATRMLRQELMNAYGRCDIDLIDKIEPILVVHDL